MAPANFPRWWPGNHTATTPTCICFIQSEADLLHQSLWHILLVSSGCLSTWMGLATSVRVQTHSLLSTLFHDVLFPPNLPQIMPPPGHHTACPLRHCVPLCRLSHIALCSCGPPLKQPLPVILSLTGLRSWYPGLRACCCVDSGHLRVLNNPFPVASALLQGEMESCLFPFKKQSPSFSSQHHMHGIGSGNLGQSLPSLLAGSKDKLSWLTLWPGTLIEHLQHDSLAVPTPCFRCCLAFSVQCLADLWPWDSCPWVCLPWPVHYPQVY